MGFPEDWEPTEGQNALADAADAAALAQAAQATADSKVTTYYQDDAPESANEGDLWIDTDGNGLHRWMWDRLALTNLVTNGDFANGTTGWTVQGQDTSPASGYASRIATARYHRILQEVLPVDQAASLVGHALYLAGEVRGTSQFLGFNTTAQQFGVSINSTDWARFSKCGTITQTPTMAPFFHLQDQRASGWDESALRRALLIDLTAAYGAGSEPTAAQMDALLAANFENSWFDGTPDEVLATGSWVPVDNSQLSAALEAAADAQATADGKIVTFAQDDEPTAAAVGDLWVDTGDANALRRWSGTEWADVKDTDIAAAKEAAASAQTAADSAQATADDATADAAAAKAAATAATNAATAPVYKIVLNCSSVSQDPSGACSPSSLSCRSYQTVASTDGTTSDSYYAGRLAIDASADGTTWTNVYTATGNSSLATIAMSTIMAAAEGCAFVRVTCYEAGGTTVQLAQAVVSVVQATGNYLFHDSTGLYVAETQGDPATGKALRLSDDGIGLLDDGEASASFERTLVKLGKWLSTTAQGDTAEIQLMLNDDGVPSGKITLEVGGTRDSLTLTSGAVVLDGYEVTLKANHLSLDGSVSTTVNGVAAHKTFTGSMVVDAGGGTDVMLWTKAAFEAAFGWDVSDGAPYVGLMNGDASASIAMMTAVIDAAGNISCLFNQATGLVRVNYLIVLPEGA